MKRLQTYIHWRERGGREEGEKNKRRVGRERREWEGGRRRRRGGGRERERIRERQKEGARERHTQRRRNVNIDAIDDVRPQQVSASWRVRRKNGTVTIGMFARAARDVLLQRGETSALLCSSDGDPSAANFPFPARCSKHAAVHLPAAGRCDDSIACTWDDIEAGYVICRGRV